MVAPLIPIVAGLGIGLLEGAGRAKAERSREERIAEQARQQAQGERAREIANMLRERRDFLLAEIAKEPPEKQQALFNPQSVTGKILTELEDRIARNSQRGGFTDVTPGGLARERQALQETSLSRGETTQAEAQREQVQEDVESLGGMVSRSLDAIAGGADAAGIMQSFDLLAQSRPDIAPQIEAIRLALPSSSEELATRQATADLAGAQPKIDALIRLGVPSQTAALAVLGRAGLQLPAAPTELGETERAGLRTEITEFDRVSQTLDRVLADLDDETVGLLGTISENIGGLGQQIPVVSSIMDQIPGLNEERVNKVITARNNFRFAVGQLAQLITQKGGRLSNQDREFVQQASGLLDVRTTPEAARRTITRLKEIVDKLRTTSRETLETGRIPSEATAPGQPVPGGTGRFTFTEDPNIFVDETTGETIDLSK